MLFNTGSTHDIVIPAPRVLFLIDPGHGGTSGQVPRGTRYNVGTSTYQQVTTLKAWGYDSPPEGKGWTEHYKSERGAGFVG